MISNLDIRSYHPSDLTALYRICLMTGDSGKNASHIFRDPDLLGHFYAAPYAVLEPDLCFILTLSAVPVGYVLGTRDSNIFSRRSESEWFPILRQRYPLPSQEINSPDAKIIRLIHAGYTPKEEILEYSAHLHIDLLPEGQGRGFGRKLIEKFINRLRVVGVSALHLEVGSTNKNAIKFYERVGFHRIIEYEKSIAFGMYLNDKA